MISYKDKLLFLSFKMILTAYLHLVETELSKENESLKITKNNIPITLPPTDKMYAYKIYDDMLSQNNRFKQLVKKIDYEISHFYSTTDFTLSIASVDNSSELSYLHLKELAFLIKPNQR